METIVPETKVLAIASHVVYGHVGNTMASFVMQALGCDVSALNTVQFSNHTGYKQFKGTKASAAEISDIYSGLQQSYLTDFDALLSGYAPNAQAVEAIGAIARDLKLQASKRPGSFVWILDPVMGDEGRLYVHEDVVPIYKSLLPSADLVLPNQFETELLSGVQIDSLDNLEKAIQVMHSTYRIPHLVVTSLSNLEKPHTLSIVGSTARSDYSSRLFRIDVPKIDCFFSGTGDMFAALTLVRFREAVTHADLLTTESWVSPDNVNPCDLPLAHAVEKVLGSMQDVLEKTKLARDQDLAKFEGSVDVTEEGHDSEKLLGLRRSKAAEIRIARCLGDLVEPRTKLKASPLRVDSTVEVATRDQLNREKNSEGP